MNKYSINYGLNKITDKRNDLDRTFAQSPNGLFLTNSCDRNRRLIQSEIKQALSNYGESQILLLDPYGEYVHFAKEIGGKIISIGPSHDTYINPFDLDISLDEYTPTKPYLSEKIDFIYSFVEELTGIQLSVSAKVLIDHTLRRMYGPYITSLKKKCASIDRKICPTFSDFYQELEQIQDSEMQSYAAVLRTYYDGTMQDLFNKTNIKTDSNFIVYDLSSVLPEQKTALSLICLNHIFLQTIANKKKNIYTWNYINHMELLLGRPSTEQQLYSLFKKSRMLAGIPTGILSTSDLIKSFESEYVRNIVCNMGVVFIQAQLGISNAAIKRIFCLPENMRKYYDNVNSYEGIICMSDTIIPYYLPDAG